MGGGVVHIYNENETIHNTKIFGCVTTYARFGIINSADTYIEKIHTKVDQGKLPPKASTGRGVHLYWGVSNFSCEEILVDDFLAAAPNNDAAVSIDGEGANPSNVSINSIVVSNSEVNGVYVTGLNHRFGKISVENYGTDSYQGHGVQDANGLEQSKELKGVWINKCTNTSFGEIAVNSKGYYPNAKYALLIDETGSLNDGPILVGNLRVTGFDFSNGPALCFGDPRSPSSNCTCIIAACDIESMPVNSAHCEWGFAMYIQPYAYAYIGAFVSDNIDLSCRVEDRGWWVMPTNSVHFPCHLGSQYAEYFIAFCEKQS